MACSTISPATGLFNIFDMDAANVFQNLSNERIFRIFCKKAKTFGNNWVITPSGFPEDLQIFL